MLRTRTQWIHFCEFGRFGSGGGAFDLAGIAGNSFGFLGILFGALFGACRFGNGGGAPIVFVACVCGIRLVCGIAGADRIAMFRLGLDVFDALGATSKSYTESNGRAGGGSFGFGIY